MFVYRIHNNILGSCIEIEDYDRGFEIIKKWCEEQDFILTEEEEQELQDTMTYENDEDPDNQYTFGIAETEPDNN